MCWYCGSPVLDPQPFGRSLRCSCGKDLRSCKNCRFYLCDARGGCKETSAEPQADKERANFCDWFSLNEKYLSQSAGQKDQKKAAPDSTRAAFDNLFK